MPFLTEKAYRADEIERRVIERWRTEGTFQATLTNRAGSPRFTFLEGPPTANGLPHPGHVLTRTLKDCVLRYKTMRGHLVERKAGWDCHGLPVEIEVEKELGLKNKGDIEAYGVAAFNQKCRESVFRYKKDWEWMSERVGFWLDFEHPYVTLDNEYIESVWWSLKQAWDKKLLYQGHRVTPSCPRCGTALSSHEVAQGYKDVEEPSVFVKFRVRDQPDTFLLAWTTTPWTLPGNVALAVGPDVEYVKARQGSETYILARDCLGVLRGEHEEVGAVKGSDLEGLEYEPLFPFLHDAVGGDAKGWFVGTADFVTTEDGTGIVHTAVMYGEDDYQFGTRLGLAARHTVAPDGTFLDFVTPYAGRFVKDADPKIIKDLDAAGLLYRVKSYTHSYPFCWRCASPLLYYARESWFIRMSAKRDDLVRFNDRVNWVPPNVKEGRFGEFIGNVRDWALSRDRYWGTPLPVWTCTGCDDQVCIGSLQELAEAADDDSKPRVADPALDLHKPAVDGIHLTCPKCQARMDREPSVIDTWYDSGAAQFAQWHYPFAPEHKDKAEVPVDFVAEGLDQTRGWFYSLLAEATFVFGRESYRNVVVNGLVLDEQGTKMSKSKKNYTDPNEVFKQYGADSMRWYLLSSSAPTADKRFFPAAIRDTYTRFFLTLWNTFQFHRNYAVLDGWTPDRSAPSRAERPLLDRWLLDRLDSTVATATREADAYNFHRATQAIEAFLVGDVSNWWLRRSRRRFWSEDASASKESAYATLHEALVTVATLAAPYAPFLAEALWLDLRPAGAPASVHLLDYPAVAGSAEATDLEREMDQIRALTEAARALRSRGGVKTRVPLQKLTLIRAGGWSDTFRALLPILQEEANVKAVDLAESAEGLEDYEAQADRARIGRELKQAAKPILEAARAMDPRELGRTLHRNGKVTIAGHDLPADMFQIRTVAAEGTLKEDVAPDTLFLDATLTPELEAEGWAREVTRRIQEMRKQAELDLQDRIVASVHAGKDILRALERWRTHIQEETRATELRLGDGHVDGDAHEWDIDGEKVTIALARTPA